VDFGGVLRQVCLAYLPEAGPGDYVLVHVGFAIARIDEEAARQTLLALEQIGELSVPEELGDAPR
jgi:hydrogenase expression/formation protein HypC